MDDLAARRSLLDALARANASIFALALSLAATPVSPAGATRHLPLDVERHGTARPDSRPGASRSPAWPGHAATGRVIARVMDPEGHAIPEQALLGNWRCRQMKLGRHDRLHGLSPMVQLQHPPVQRRPAVPEDGWQPALCWNLFPENGAWVYLGASSARGEPWHNYSGASPRARRARHAGRPDRPLTGIGDNHLRLEMPAVQELLLDVVEFSR